MHGAVISRLRREWHLRAFNHTVREIFDGPPLVRGTRALTLVSMVQSRDTASYLLALLSFARYANPQRVVVVSDPSMTAADLQALRLMVPHIELRRAEEFRHPAFPVGGCWERLCAITEYARSSYIIQLDADTVCLEPPEEVIAAVECGRGFVLGERPQQRLNSLDEASAYAAQWQPPDLHIQALAEQMLPLASLAGSRYVRGCAAFTGFACAADLKERLVEFSTQLRRLTGERWDEWGSEQVASNYLVANQHDTTVLPFPTYATPDQLEHKPKFVHFIGSQRFENGQYAQVAGALIRELQAC